MATTQTAGAGRGAKLAKWVALHVLRAVWLSTMVLTPLFGFWLASSLAAYQNASQWLALLVGLMLFPLIPVGWELFHAWRKSKRPPEKAILTRLDRLVLRTLIVNGVFLVGMMWFAKHTAFRSLAQRGDWMLDGHDGAVASTLRGWMLGFADHFDRHGTEKEVYGESDNAPDPSKLKRHDPWDVPTPTPGTTTVPKSPTGWPLPDDADPKVAEMPESAKASIDTVGAYLKEQFPDRKQRVKAIHDFVVLHLDYDYDALKLIEAKDYLHTPPETAEAVFARKKGVCEGYARLMVAVGKAANVEIMYVTGYIRDSSRRLTVTESTAKSALDGYLHAWNAVLIDDEWFLIDATWDDPKGARTPVRSTYLFTPPQYFAYNHHPDDPAWQLVMSPISLGDFARQPFLSPSMGRLGVTLESPTRSQVTVSGEVTLVVDNPYHANLQALARLDNGKTSGAEIRCEPKPRSTGTKVDITCDLPDGEYEVSLYGSPSGSGGWLDHLGSILVNSH